MMFQISVNDFAALKSMCSAIVLDIVSLRTWWQKPGLTIYNTDSICKLAMLFCMLNVILEFCLWDGIICLFVCNQILHSIIRVTPSSTFLQSMRIPQLWRVSAWMAKDFFKKGSARYFILNSMPIL